MKKLIYIISVTLLVVIAAGCEDFLDTRNLYEKSLDNYYETPQDINEAMAGVYHAMYTPDVLSMEGLAANLLSDMMLGGGGPDDKTAKRIDNFTDPEEDTYHDLWKQSYNGIYRANTIIEKVQDADFSEHFYTEEEATEFKNQALGEAYFMRAFFYFRLGKFFGGVPLILSVDAPRDVPRASFTETFAQIASDLVMAIETMPDKPITEIPLERYGHATKWVAEGYLGRVYLFYTGYMTNMENSSTSELPLADGGSLSASQVAGYLEDCIDNSGHELAEDFRNLWPYSYINESAGEVVLPWAEAEGLAWVGQDGPFSNIGTGNFETMFVTRYAFGNWEWGQYYNNRLPLFFGMRDNSLVPFGQGWGWGTVNYQFWNSWDDNDPRKKGSILETGSAEMGTQDYAGDKGDHETGYFNKKYHSLQHDGPDGVCGMFYYVYGITNKDMQLWHAQDFILMRFADVLLMHSEITQTPTGMDEVRDRAGLVPHGTYSLANLKEERKYEFAFEGLRWFDLVRWGDVNTAFDYTLNVRNSGMDAQYSVTYRPETKGLLPIPETEIRLSNGVYQQNPGW
ncbi:MAG TPA: RagB/SusD family nutrient uptake outer membrane protein [Bacteroidetes bacterium]|nr:RagB/SusD family nutrient uptake outer membrane protein [Bacteroidota bacterium]